MGADRSHTALTAGWMAVAAFAWMSPSPARGDVNAATMLHGVAGDVARATIPRLQAEGSRVVFLNMPECDLSSLNGTDDCGKFRAAVESELSRAGVMFLPERQAEEIRGKIARELEYQHNSLLVPVERAVALGKQAAFQSFVTLTVKANSQELWWQLTAVSIKAAAVTLSLSKYYRMSAGREYAALPVLGALALAAGGVAGTVYSYKWYSYHRSQAGDAYSEYQGAATKEAATYYRQRTEYHEGKARDSYAAALASAALTCGAVIWGYSQGAASVRAEEIDGPGWGREVGLRGWVVPTVLMSDAGSGAMAPGIAVNLQLGAGAR